MATLDPTGLCSALANDLYTQGRNALSDVITLERQGKELKEGYLDDLLSLTREVLARHDNASTPPEALRMLKELRNFMEDMSKQVSAKQSRNLLERWSAAQKIKGTRKKLEQFLHKVNWICLLLNGQDMAAMLNGIAAQISTLPSQISTQVSTLTIPTPQVRHLRLHDGGQLRFDEPPASSCRFSVSRALPPPEMPPVGIDKELATLSSWLLDEGGAPWICVSGMGGIGKSYLVHTVCLSPEVKRHFQDRILWVILGTKPQVLELQRDLCEEISGRSSRLLPSPEEGRNALYSHASTHRYLVVLDDAWMGRDIPRTALGGLKSLNFLNASNGSRIVVTSRDRSLLDRLGVVVHRNLELRGLADDDSYTLFCKHAFNTQEAPQNLGGYARYLAGRCGGVPFVLEVVGKAMRSKREVADWEYVLDKLSRGVLDERAGMLELLRLSYDQLLPVQQERFLVLAILDGLWINRYLVHHDDFVRIAWQSMELLDNCRDAFAERAFEEAVDELVSCSLAAPLGFGRRQNEWIGKLGWHIIKEKEQPAAQDQQDRDKSSTSFRVLVISRDIESTVVLLNSKLLLTHDTNVLRSSMDNFLQLRALHWDGSYDVLPKSIPVLQKLVCLSMTILGITNRQRCRSIEKALGNLIKLEFLLLISPGTVVAVDLTFLEQMRSLRHLAIYGPKEATSGSNIKHCHRLSYLDLRLRLADAHLNDLLHPKSSLETVHLWSMSRESASGDYPVSIPSTLKSFVVDSWTGSNPTGNQTGNFTEPVSSSFHHQIFRLDICLPTLECFGRLHSLQGLRLDGCGQLAHLTSLDRLPRLKHLTLDNCAVQRLSNLAFPKLERLRILDCQSLVEIRDIDAPSLSFFTIRGCDALVDIEINAPQLRRLGAVPRLMVEIQRLCSSVTVLQASWSGIPTDLITGGSLSQFQNETTSSPFSNLVGLEISVASESLPECFGCPNTLPQLKTFKLDGCGVLVHLPSFARLPRLFDVQLENCAMESLPLAAGRPGFPALQLLHISKFKYLVKIQGLCATRLGSLRLDDCPSLVEIDADFLSSSQLQHERTTSYTSPFSNLGSLSISLALESLPECFGCPNTLPQLQTFTLDGCGVLLHLPSLARLRLSDLRLENCAMASLPLAAPPGIIRVVISGFKNLVKIQGLCATQLESLCLHECPSLVEIHGLQRRVRLYQSDLGGDGYFPADVHSESIYRQARSPEADDEQPLILNGSSSTAS